jgi:hypothetical protein
MSTKGSPSRSLCPAPKGTLRHDANNCRPECLRNEIALAEYHAPSTSPTEMAEQASPFDNKTED